MRGSRRGQGGPDPSSYTIVISLNLPYKITKKYASEPPLPGKLK